MKIIHQCNSTVGWQPVRIDSTSEAGRVYTVHVNPWGHTAENICECNAYIYRGRCKHQDMAAQRLCGWHEVVGPEEIPPENRRLGICPRCGGATHRTVMEDEV